MNLFELYATINLNSKQFESAIKGAEGSLASLGKSVVNTQVLIKGVEAAFGALKKVVGDGVNEYAKYEQLVGGVETLFKGSSQKVQEYAKQAYKTAGLSANQYMETATSFSASLIQGLKGNTDKAADLANVAITDMADNANKMGTDITAIQNAYQGFAKANFTMLDNLRLGYGGTKTEMVRLINDSGVLDKKIKSVDEVSFDKMIEAIHAIQKELGITGTTAQEAASTIQGSKASLYSAFQNLLTFTTEGTNREQIQKAQDEFVESFATYFNDNLTPRITTALGGAGAVFDAIAAAILTVPEDTLSNMVAEGLQSGASLVNGLTNVAGVIIGQLAAVFTNPENTQEGASNLGVAIGNFIGTTIVDALTTLPEVIPGLLEAGVNLAAGLVEGLVQGLTGEDSLGLEEINETMNQAWEDAFGNAMEAEGIITYLDDLIEKYGDTASSTDEWADAIDRLVGLDDSYAAFFDDETGRLTASTDALREHTKELRRNAIQRAANLALQDKYNLMGQLTVQQATLQADINYQRSQQKAHGGAAVEFINRLLADNEVEGTFSGALTQELSESIADAILRSNGSAEGYDEDTFQYMREQQAEWIRNQIGFMGLNVGDNMSSVDLIKFAQLIANQATVQGESKEQLEALNKKYTESQRIIDQDQKDMEAVGKDMQTLETEINNSEQALAYLVTAAEDASEALGNLAGSQGGDNKPMGLRQSSSGDWNWGPGKATGMDRVPYDGFRAELHKDEAVLTRAEAAEWRRGGTAVGFDTHSLAQTIAGAVREGMASVGFYFDKEKVAAAITDDVSRNVVNGMAAWGYA